MTRLDQDPSEPALKEWRDYRHEPGPSTFGRLVAATTDASDMRAVQIAMQQLYWESDNWKIAQHLAMLLSGSEAHFPNWPSDQLLASYFAAYALANSNSSPLAHLIEARIFWERRLCPAALHNLAQIAEARDLEDMAAPLLAEYHTLRALCDAYLGWPDKAWAEMTSHPTKQHETLHQLLCALSEGNSILDRLAPVLMPMMDQLTPEHRGLFLRHFRGQLLSLLRSARGEK